MNDEWPEGKVAVSKSRSRPSGVCKYHTTRCERFPSKPKWWRREVCESWDNFTECSYCSGEADHSTNNQRSQKGAVGVLNSD